MTAPAKTHTLLLRQAPRLARNWRPKPLKSFDCDSQWRGRAGLR
jgi:hypothetical protein